MAEPLDIKKAAAEIDSIGMREWLLKEFALAFKEARKNKLRTFNEHAYEVNWAENIVKLVDAVLSFYYRPSPSISFVVFSPKTREIFAAPFVDRIIHHFLYRMQCDWWDRRFILDSYSCREGKGTLYAVKRVQKMMQQATDNYTKDAYIIKLDIKSYFMSLPRKKLYRRVKWGLKHQFEPYRNLPSAHKLYKICLFLWHQILFDDPASKSKKRGPRENWLALPPGKSLYDREPDIGIVIGNLTSQLVSNIYLDQIDRYIKYELKCKYYGRYVDDLIFIIPEEEYEKFKKNIKKIRHKFKIDLSLEIHPNKCYIGSVYKGVEFLGARIYPHCLYPSNRLQKNFIATIAKMRSENELVKNDTIISYFGFLMHLDADKFVKKVFERFHIGYDLYEETKRKDRRSWDDIIYDMKCDLRGLPRPSNLLNPPKPPKNPSDCDE